MRNLTLSMAYGITFSKRGPVKHSNSSVSLVKTGLTEDHDSTMVDIQTSSSNMVQIMVAHNQEKRKDKNPEFTQVSLWSSTNRSS